MLHITGYVKLHIKWDITGHVSDILLGIFHGIFTGGLVEIVHHNNDTHHVKLYVNLYDKLHTQHNRLFIKPCNMLHSMQCSRCRRVIIITSKSVFSSSCRQGKV
jgi:hypothetical protein